MRAIRGAITVDENSREAILAATRELLTEILQTNALSDDELVSAIFTLSPDLNACFPAEAAREIGWSHVPLLCTREIDVPGSLARCIRVLVHADIDRSRDRIRHIYLRDAVSLRPDLRYPQ